LGEVAKHTHIALEGCDQVIPIPGGLVSKQILGTRPLEAALILGLGMMEGDVGGFYVTRTTPDSPTRSPPTPRGGKVCTKDPSQILLHDPTGLAVADPLPKILGGVLPARV
jgi:hypothetical protein